MSAVARTVQQGLLRRAAHRVAAHRREALAVLAVWVPATATAAALDLFPRLAGIIARHPGASFAGALVLGMATLWLPIAVIDARRCTRESKLRALVEADLAREVDARRRRVDEDDLIIERVTDVLESGALQIVYQPIVEIGDGRVVGYEALSRFPDGAAPDSWFRLAARVGLGVDLELAAIRQAVRAMPELPEHTYLSVNASPAMLLHPGILPVLGEPWSRRIVLELTEHDLVDDYEAFAAARRHLEECGVRLAIDDAGAGYASLRHILDLSPDVIKLDSSLVQGIDDDPARRSLVKVLTEFASDIDAVLVAEGVEELEQAQELARLGVPYAQGWFYGVPVPVEGIVSARLKRGFADTRA